MTAAKKQPQPDICTVTPEKSVHRLELCTTNFGKPERTLDTQNFGYPTTPGESVPGGE